MKTTIIAAAIVAIMATGANADAFGECAAKIAAAKIAAEHGLSPESESSLIWEAITISTARTMTELGESLRKLLDQGMEYAEIEDEMLQAGGDPDVLRIAGLCQNEL